MLSRPWLKNYPAFADWKMDIPAEPAFAAFNRSVKAYPTKTCIDFYGRSWTYTETKDIVHSVATGLQKLGVEKGHHIGIMLPNTPHYVFCFLAINLIGAVAVNISPLYAQDHLSEIIKDSKISILISIDVPSIHDKAIRLLHSNKLQHHILCSLTEVLPWQKSIMFAGIKYYRKLKNLGIEKTVSFRKILNNQQNYSQVEINPLKDIAVIQYTGGTTGTPKGVLLTHANLSANTIQIESWYDKTKLGEESILAVLPLFHIFGLTVCMLSSIRQGGKLILLPRFSIVECLKSIEKNKPTFFPAVPSIFTAIIDYSQTHKYDLSSIKLCFSGGAPLPIKVKAEFEQITGCTITEGYGLSETSPVATTNPSDKGNKPGSVGIPMPNTDIKIISLDGKGLELTNGQKGEVCIKGPQVMKGYWSNYNDTKAALQNGFFRTGDIGFIDKEGYLFLVDRLKDIIIAGGHNIYPSRVERAIMRHPNVLEVAVIGVHDKYRGETPRACVKLKTHTTLTAAQLGLFLKSKLSSVEMPTSIDFRKELPKTVVGKIDKTKLRSQEPVSSINSKLV